MGEIRLKNRNVVNGPLLVEVLNLTLSNVIACVRRCVRTCVGFVMVIVFNGHQVVFLSTFFFEFSKI